MKEALGVRRQRVLIEEPSSGSLNSQAQAKGGLLMLAVHRGLGRALERHPILEDGDDGVGDVRAAAFYRTALQRFLT